MNEGYKEKLKAAVNSYLSALSCFILDKKEKGKIEDFTSEEIKKQIALVNYDIANIIDNLDEYLTE